MHDAPIKLSEALYLAAEVARRNEELEAELFELRMNNEYPEVLLTKHIMKLCGVSRSTISQWAQDSEFPHLMGDWQKGQVIRCKKSEFYNWLRNRKLGKMHKNKSLRIV